MVNIQKSTVYFSGLEDEEARLISQLFPYQQTDVQEGLKYLGFYLKPNDYDTKDWH